MSTELEQLFNATAVQPGRPVQIDVVTSRVARRRQVRTSATFAGALAAIALAFSLAGASIPTSAPVIREVPRQDRVAPDQEAPGRLPEASAERAAASGAGRADGDGPVGDAKAPGGDVTGAGGGDGEGEGGVTRPSADGRFEWDFDDGTMQDWSHGSAGRDVQIYPGMFDLAERGTGGSWGLRVDRSPAGSQSPALDTVRGRAVVTSPIVFVAEPQDRVEVRVRRRWTKWWSATDVLGVDLLVGSARADESEFAVIALESVTAGSHQQPDWVDGSWDYEPVSWMRQFRIQLWAEYDQPVGQPCTSSADRSEGAPCDLGLTLDDIELVLAPGD